jgi:hypothetical protein
VKRENHTTFSVIVFLWACFKFSQKLVPLTHNPPTPLWNNPLPPFPLNKGGQRGLYKGEGDWGRGVVYKVAKWQEGKEARGQRTISPVTKPYLIGFRI